MTKKGMYNRTNLKAKGVSESENHGSMYRSGEKPQIWVLCYLPQVSQSGKGKRH